MVFAEDAQIGDDYSEYNPACIALLPTDVVACPDMTAKFLDLSYSADHEEETINAAKELVAKLTAGCETDSQKAIAIRHWVCETIDYSLTPTHTTPHPEGETCPGIISCIIRGTGLNQGSCGTFSAVYSYLLTAAGIPNGEVLLDCPGSTTDHAMNVVFADGKWYQVDAEGPNYGSNDIIYESPVVGKNGVKIRSIFFANNDKCFGIHDGNDDGIPELQFLYYIIEHEHVYSETPVSVTESTCSTFGEEVYQCTTEPEYCKKKKVVKLPFKEHNYETEPSIVRTANLKSDTQYGAVNLFDYDALYPHYCEYDTLKFYKCSDCYYNYGVLEYKVEVVPATGGNVTETVTKEPTCTLKGIKKISCSECEYSETVTIPAIGHDFSDELTVNKATCTKYGSSYYKCKNCDMIKDYVAIPAGHKYEEISRTDATCKTNTETVVFECTVCHDVKTEYNFVPVDHTPSEPDSFGTIVCAVCGSYITTNDTTGGNTDNTIDNKVDNNGIHVHTSVYSIVTKEPTCINRGVETHYCECGETFTKDLNLANHDFKWITTKKATYFTNGEKVYKCSVCGKINKTAIITQLKLKTPKVKYTGGKKKVTVKYTKVAGATGFQVRYRVKGKWTVKTFNVKRSATKVVKNLKKGKYKVQTRVFAKQGDKKAYSSWTKAKVIRVK